MKHDGRTARLFRVWIATYSDWQPSRWNQLPPQATALEPADERLCSATEAAAFLEGFNRLMLGSVERLWAVAVPITLRYDGDARPGAAVQGFAFDEIAGDEHVAGRPCDLS